MPAPVRVGRPSRPLRITMIASAVLICLWVLAWTPPARRPALLEWFLFWCNDLLDVLFVPAVLALWWSSYRSRQPRGEAEE